MNSCEFKEIFVVKDFGVDNGVLGLERDIFEYCSIPRFVNKKKSMNKYIFFSCIFYL
jgi:hypothetical protein